MTGAGQDILLAVSAASILIMIAFAVWSAMLLHREIRTQLIAEQRAKALLDELLTEAERGQLAKTGRLTVHSAEAPSREYLVPRWGGFVDVHEAGTLACRLCVQPTDWLPSADVVLMHKLLIEGDEQGYLRQANVQWLQLASGRDREPPQVGAHHLDQPGLA